MAIYLFWSLAHAHSKVKFNLNFKDQFKHNKLLHYLSLGSHFSSLTILSFTLTSMSLTEFPGQLLYLLYWSYKNSLM